MAIFACYNLYFLIMKKLFAALFITLLSAQVSLAQNLVPVHFNECVDLMATIWRLSGSNEYNRCMVPIYAHEVDSVFAPFKEHPVVKKASCYQQEYGIGYDAVASYGLHLTLTESGAIVLNDSFLEGGDNSFDRWPDQQKKEFLEPLNDFYRASHFHDWYSKQENLHEQFKQAFDAINQQVDYSWFDNYFGPQSGSTFCIVLSLLVGPNNYGCSAQLKDGSTTLSPVIGNCHVDENGNASYNANSVLPIVIHEFCHHYCNPLNDQFWPLMSQSAKKVFKEREKQLRQEAYSSAKTMMDETFVRASVIRYMKTHYPQIDEQALVKEEEKHGFILTQTLCDALKYYEQQRETYVTMSDFMPVYVKAVNDFDLKQYKKQQKQQAKLNATYKVNLKNGAKNVPSGPFLLTIVFSKPMTEGISLYIIPGTDFPPFKGYSWHDEKTLEVSFLLEPSHQYGFIVKGDGFYTKDGHNAGKDTEITFITGE